MTNDGSVVSIVLSGEAGQGLKTLETLFSKIVRSRGFHAFTYTEFMSRIRGGNNTTEIRFGSKPCAAFVDRIDVVISLQKEGLKRLVNRISPDTLIIGDRECIDTSFQNNPFTAITIPFSAHAAAAGGKILLNTVALGVLAAIFGIDAQVARDVIKSSLRKNDDETLRKNGAAFNKGYEEGVNVAAGKKFRIAPRSGAPIDTEFFLTGADAVGIGALGGGCTFLAAYPMSPATSVLEFIAKHAGQFGVAVDQAEDEIAAINMAIGSWYAGGRALVSTSGGGFALMEEGVSLAGCMESPLVIHIGQRPGPATGLPTRTEQGDLNLALYAGHGEFPRVILAPADHRDCAELTCKAFFTADSHQVPVFILTDQYLLDSCGEMGNVNFGRRATGPVIVPTDASYKRYAPTSSGISPRGIPGYGTGIVCADSDEHDEYGYITEDFAMRTAMVNKRLKKLSALESEAVEPRFEGPRDFTKLIVGWGSTLNALREALAVAGRDDTALLHFSQVYPIGKTAGPLLERARTRIAVENNATGQFAALLTATTNLSFHKKVLKYNGMPFSVEELTAQIASL